MFNDENSAVIGGFVCYSDNGGYKTVFKDCSFVGSFREKKEKNDYWHDTGGFVGLAVDDVTVELHNCLSCITFSGGKSEQTTGYFVGHCYAAKVNSSNCYCYYPLSNPANINTDDSWALDDDQIMNGETATKLAAGRTGDNPWRQTLGIDAQPETTVSSPQSKVVYHPEASTRPATTDKCKHP